MSYDAYRHQRASNLYEQSGREPQSARRRHPEDRYDDNTRQQERNEQQYGINLYQCDPDKYQEYFYALQARNEAEACPDLPTYSNNEGNTSQPLQPPATLPDPCASWATSKGKPTNGTSGPHIKQDNRGTQKKGSGPAYKNLHQRPGPVNAPQQTIDGNQLQKTEIRRAPPAIPMQSKKDSHVTNDAVRPALPAVEHQQKKDVGQVSRISPLSVAPMSLFQPKATIQGHNPMLQRAPPAVASSSNNFKPSNRATVQLARLSAELAQKTQEIQKIRKEYVKLQQAQLMQAVQDEKEAAVRTNPAIVTESKNDRNQTDITVRGDLKDKWEIEEIRKAFQREQELFLAQARVPVLIKKEPMYDNQLSAPMATAEAIQRRLSIPKDDSLAPIHMQELHKRVFDWLEFT
jgi:hypothetical protein